PHYTQHERTEGYVEAVEAGQQEEGGTIDTGIQSQTELAVSVCVLLNLQEQEHDTQQNSQTQPGDQLLTLVVFQRSVRDVHGYAGGQQQDGVPQRQIAHRTSKTRPLHGFTRVLEDVRVRVA